MKPIINLTISTIALLIPFIEATAQCNYYQFPTDTTICGNTATFTYPNLIPFRRFPFVGNFGSNNANLSVYFGVGTTGNTFTITNTTGGNLDTTIVYRIDPVDCSPWVGFINVHFQTNTTPLNIVNQVGPCNEVAMLMVTNSGGATPSWSKLVGSTYVPVGTITSYTATTTGSYKATINTENGCPASGTINIASLGSPKKYLHDTSYCQTVGQPNFSIVDNQNTFCSYLWNNTNTGDEWVINPNTYMTGVGTAWVTITNAAGCVTKDTINWQAWNLPNPLLNSGVYICNGSAVTLYDSSTNNYNHIWSYGGTYVGNDDTLIATQTGTYHVFTTTEHGCSADNDVYVLESDVVDVAGFSFVPQQPYSARQIYFHALDVENVIDYLWDFGDGTTSNQVTPIHTFIEADSSLITLTVSNPNLNGDCKLKTTQVLKDELGKYEDLKLDLEYRITTACNSGIFDLDTLSNWMQVNFQAISNLVASLRELLNRALKKYLGEPGVASDLKGLYYVASSIARMYSEMVKWSIMVKSTKVHEDYHSLKEILSDFPSVALSQIWEYPDFTIQEIKQGVQRYNSDPTQNIEIKATLVISANDEIVEKFSKELNQLKNAATYRY